MSFKKVAERRVWRTINWVGQDENGTEQDYSIDVLLRIPAPRLFASLVRELEGVEAGLFLAPEQVVPLVKRICLGWRRYTNAEGVEIAFEDAEITDLFGNAGVMAALINGYALAYASAFEARRKNSEASAPGGHALTDSPSMPQATSQTTPLTTPLTTSQTTILPQPTLPTVERLPASS
jgi:hypothetical protein